MATSKNPLPAKANAASSESPRKGSNGRSVATTQNVTPTTTASESKGRKKGPTTRITIKYDVGFANAIYLRGKGADLSWEYGIALNNSKPDEWVWETTTPFTTCEFKVLINDTEYEVGDNHMLTCGATIEYTPKFF